MRLDDLVNALTRKLKQLGDFCCSDEFDHRAVSHPIAIFDKSITKAVPAVPLTPRDPASSLGGTDMSKANDSSSGLSAHDGPHRLVASRDLGDGWSLGFWVSDNATHARMTLHFGETPGEVLSCLHIEDPIEIDDWGFGVPDVLRLTDHAAWHLKNSIPPGDCGEDLVPL